jgi:phospholipase/carboxylesterase
MIMNRIATLTNQSFAISAAQHPFQSPVVSTLTRRRLQHADETFPPYARFAPVHYEPGYAYPLLVWLHDRAGNEHQIRRIMPHISMRNFVAVAPRGTVASRRRQGAFDWQQSGDSIEEAEARVMHCIDGAKARYHINCKRVFIMGSGNGGTMAMRIAWTHPERFAGVATLGGRLPTRFCPLRRIHELRGLPCLIAAARQSGNYPEAEVCRDLRLMHSAGCTVSLRQYPGCDGLTTRMLSDLNRWIMDLVCGG